MAMRFFLLLAGFSAVSTLLLAAALRFPEVLLDPPSIGSALAGQNSVLAVIGLLGLLVCGVLVVRISQGRGRWVTRLGWAGGGLLTATAVVTPLSLWVNVSWIAFWCVTLAAAVLAAWTIAIAREVGRGLVAAILGAVGLVLFVVRSVVWVVNLARPVVDGFWVASAVVSVLTLLFLPLWMLWSLRMGLRPSRRGVLRRVGAGLAAVGVAVAYAGATVGTTPTPSSDDVPAVPSSGAAAFYVLMLAISGQISPAADLATLREMRQNDRYTKPEPPAGATMTHVDADGVPADWICAPGVPADRAVLYLHGGGFVMPVSNGHRQHAATLSRALDACVLLPDYRLAPEHPFPAPVDDTVHAYEYLRGQGIAAKRIVMLGDSCGGTFTLAAALKLRDAGTELPGALVALSGGFDLTVSGETHRTKAHSDAELGADDVRFSADSYTAGGVDPSDPLVSPLFADLRGLPPTLLIAGTQEVLASDSVRLADRMREAGVPVRLEMFPGLPHDFPIIVEEIMESDLALRHITTFVSRHVS
jgi:acetyl esterase/lipase